MRSRSARGVITCALLALALGACGSVGEESSGGEEGGDESGRSRSGS